MGGILRHSKLVTMEKADMKVAKNLGAFGYLYRCVTCGTYVVSSETPFSSNSVTLSLHSLFSLMGGYPKMSPQENRLIWGCGSWGGAGKSFSFLDIFIQIYIF